jgi:hypothetical protein
MSQLLRFTGSVRRDRAVDRWMTEHSGELGAIAKRWFDVMRRCGSDVRELLHDGAPTVFRGAEIADPEGLLEGDGRFMRHVKLRPDEPIDAKALRRLIHTAYADIRRRLKAETDGAV